MNISKKLQEHLQQCKSRYFHTEKFASNEKINTQKQLSIAVFAMSFEANLDVNNRWFVLSGVISWDKFADLYYINFSSCREAPTKDARMVLGVVIIKHMLKLDDIGVIEIIQENPYMQYSRLERVYTKADV